MVASLSGVVVESEDQDGILRLFVSNPLDSIQRFHMIGDWYEREELDMMAEAANPNRAVVDIGANVGNHSVYLGRRFPSTTIVPFELNELACRILSINVLLNKLANVNTTYLGLGLGAEDTKVDLVVAHANNLGLGRVVEATDGRLRVIAGDSVLGTCDVGLIKLDVEGYEMKVLEGLARTIGRCRPQIFVEVENSNRRALNSWANRNGYRTESSFKRYEINENLFLVPEP